MNNTVQAARERVLLLIETKGTNVNALAKSIDIPQATLASQLRRGTIQINVIEGLLRTYPDISPDWLIMGIGNMYRTNTDQLRTTDQYYALVDSLAELQRKHDAEMQAMILANQRGSNITISNVGNTTINNNNNNPKDDSIA